MSNILSRHGSLRPSLSLLVALAACTSTEAGNPPLQPTGITPESARAEPFMCPPGVMCTPGSGPPVLITGAPGALVPEARLLRTTNLDEPDSQVETSPNDDGSFQFIIGARSGEVLRMQVFTETDRLRPLDLLRDADGLVVVSPPRDCVDVPSAVAVETDGSAQILIDNTCSEAVTFAAPTTRGEGASTSSTPLTVESGATDALSVSLLTDIDEEFVFLSIEASGDASARFTVTVHRDN